MSSRWPAAEGAHAVATAIDDAFVKVTEPTKQSFAVREISFRKGTRGIYMDVVLDTAPLWGRKKKAISFTVRMPRARAESVRARIARRLGE